MPLGEYNNVVRIVEGLRGRVAMQMQVRPRYSLRLIPAIGRIDQGIFAVAGPDAVHAYDRGDERGKRRGIGGVHGLGR